MVNQSYLDTFISLLENEKIKHIALHTEFKKDLLKVLDPKYVTLPYFLGYNYSFAFNKKYKFDGFGDAPKNKYFIKISFVECGPKENILMYDSPYWSPEIHIVKINKYLKLKAFW